MKFVPFPPYWWPENDDETMSQLLMCVIVLPICLGMLFLINSHQHKMVDEWINRAHIENASVTEDGWNHGPFPYSKGQFIVIVKGIKDNRHVTYWVEERSNWEIDEENANHTYTEIYSGANLP